MSRYSKAAHATGIAADQKISSAAAIDEQISLWVEVGNAGLATYHTAKARVATLQKRRAQIIDLLA